MVWVLAVTIPREGVLVVYKSFLSRDPFLMIVAAVPFNEREF